MTVEGPPVSERNWACKHLAALARTFPSRGVSEYNSSPKGHPAASTGGCHPPGANVKKENMTIEDWKRGTGVDAVCQRTVIEDGWSDGEHSEGEEENRDEGGNNHTKKHFTLEYKIPCDHHGLSHFLNPRSDGSLPLSSSPDPPSAIPDRLTLQQELDRDPEAHMLAASTLGCILRRCLFRDGKGGVHLSNYGQARLEENVFRGLNYAVRCIQNATVSKIPSNFCFTLMACVCDMYQNRFSDLSYTQHTVQVTYQVQVAQIISNLAAVSYSSRHAITAVFSPASDRDAEKRGLRVPCVRCVSAPLCSGPHSRKQHPLKRGGGAGHPQRG